MTPAGLTVKSLDHPDETRPLADRGRVDVVTLPGARISRAIHDPGWRWTTHVAPTAGVARCPLTHTGVIVSGRLVVQLEDGSEALLTPGAAFVIPPGHDAWVEGDEACVMIDFAAA